MDIASKIAGVGYAIPDRKISNADVLGRLEMESCVHLGKRSLLELLRRARRMLESAGSGTRYWCREDEFCTDIALEAARMAVADAGIDAEEIDYLIFTGMSKAFVEPASAHVLRAGLGAERAVVIDTQDACTSFIKSLQIADCLIRSGGCRKILIASGERTFDWADFACTRLEDLTWKFGSLTIGDGAGAMVLQATQDPGYLAWPYHFHFACRAVSNTFSYCQIGLNHAQGERYKLRSHSGKLFKTATDAALDLIADKQQTDPDWLAQRIECLLFHDIGQYLQKKVMPAFSHFFPNVTWEYLSYFNRLGNIGSSSLPVGLALSREAGMLNRGDRVLFACPAAGVQAGILTFVY